jgi:localization factor PodJL
MLGDCPDSTAGGLRVEMQTELPWNVAGISPEAREAARAAARREGLSVGEWLTRRIVAGQTMASDDPTPSGWSFPGSEASVRPIGPDARVATPEIQDMAARIVRNEGETQNAYKAIDQQLKAVARRLETAERNQTENNRALAQAATQINIAAREQGQALEQMTTNVTALTDRLARVERQATQDGMREAVKALHHGLSHVADQIAQTASQSTSQLTALTGNIDSLTSRLLETREKADGIADAVDTRLASLDDRLRLVERTAFSSASALDHTMENLEQLRAAQDRGQDEAQRQAIVMGQIKDDFGRVDSRISANEAEAAGATARFEEALARLQTLHPDDPVDRRLQGIEHVLADLVGRIEQTERTNLNANGGVEQTLRELSAGLGAADQRNREAIEQLQVAIHDSAAKIAAIESKVSTVQANKPAEPIFDMPTFPEPLPAQEAGDSFSPPPFPFEERASEDHSAPVFGEPFADMAPPAAEPAESYLFAARQAARGAADAETSPRASMGDFAWTFAHKEKSEPPREGAKRYLMAGSIFGVAVAAALTGMVLTRGVGSQPAHLPQATTITTPISSSQNAASTKLAAPSGSVDDAVNDDPTSQPAARLPVPSHKVTAKPAHTAGVAAAPANTMLAATNPTNTSPAKTMAHPVAATGMLPGTISAPPALSPSVLQRLTALANTGDSKGQLLLGLKYLSGSGVAANEAEAARWLSRAAQQGEPLAEYRLGTLYERGRGVPADAKQATHWYELAARQGNRKAMHNLAVAFAEGAGEPKDSAQAALWFAKAAHLGLADSQFNLAVLYERGMGVQQSLGDAYKWYLIAAAQGDAESKKRADALATQLRDSDRNAAQQAAAAFKPQEPNPAANSVPALG